MDCPKCHVEMFYREDRGFHVCPQCLGEWWESELTKTYIKQQKEKSITQGIILNSDFYFGLAQSTHDINAKPVLPPGKPVIKGGSKSGKSRKKKIKRNIRDTITYT